MYEFNIKLPYKIENCAGCPFRRESTTYENVETSDKLTGVISFLRRNSFCLLKEEPIFVNENVEGFNSKCPLKGKIQFYPDEK